MPLRAPSNLALGAIVSAMLAALGALCTGCASDPEAAVDGRAAVRPAGPVGSAVGSENGLEIRKLVLQDDEGAVGRALLDFGNAYSGDGAERLTRNGYLLMRVAATEIDALVERLGSPLTDLRTWHGQAPEWRDLVRIPARQPVGAIVDGRPRVFEDGSLRLLLRAWTLPTEDGAVLELQMCARFQPVTRGVSLVVDPSIEEERGQRVGGSIELHLHADEVWILTCLLPRDAPPPPEEPEVRRDGMPARATRDRPATRGPVPDDVMGPGAALPPTLGALLLSTEIPATRTLFVIQPRLPDVAHPERPELDSFAPDEVESDQPSTAADTEGGAGEATLRGGNR